VYDEDCGAGSVCVNASCVRGCEGDAGCPAGEVCHSGACGADVAPERECSEQVACPTDMICERGVCRLPCVAAINCRGEMNVCGEGGFCMHPAELQPGCTRAADCSAGQACLSNTCVAFAD
jgi:hypothetical protein